MATNPRPRRAWLGTAILRAERFHSEKIRWSDWPKSDLRMQTETE